MARCYAPPCLALHCAVFLCRLDTLEVQGGGNLRIKGTCLYSVTQAVCVQAPAVFPVSVSFDLMLQVTVEFADTATPGLSIGVSRDGA